ncbi:hypothetical protein GCM10009528_45900 [Kineococcus aurantiacus]
MPSARAGSQDVRRRERVPRPTLAGSVPARYGREVIPSGRRRAVVEDGGKAIRT